MPGVSVQRLKVIAIVLVSAATGAAVAVSGVIGFVGIVVPHLIRLLIGPAHRVLLPSIDAARCRADALRRHSGACSGGASRGPDRHHHSGNRGAVLSSAFAQTAFGRDIVSKLIDATGAVVQVGERIILRGIDLSVGSGEIVALVGPNGAR